MSTAAAEKKHPLGLYILFFTEMWERFSYYGMRALLMPYMISATFGYQPGAASSVYKWYTSLVYLTPLFGGLIADRLIGARAAVLIGAVLMAVGHFLMALPSQGIFFAALACLIAGNGFFKPNISTMVGRMYGPNDSRRDGAFTIFYMGINLGAFLSSMICPSLREWRGFDWGFGAAGIGMLIGLVVFFFGQKRVVADIEAAGNTAGRITAEKVTVTTNEKDDAAYRDAAKTETAETDISKPGATGVAGMLATIYPFFMIAAAIAIVSLYVFKVSTGAAKPISLIMPIAFGGVFIVMATLLMKLRGAQRDKSTSIFIMFLFPVLFWMAFEQAGNALNLWAEIHTDRKIGFMNREYPGGWWQSANALMIFVLAPVFTILWSSLAKRGKEPSTPWKMFYAMVLMALSFVVMVFGAASENSTTSTVELTKAPAATVPWKELNAGRLSLEGSTLQVKGVLPDFAVRDSLAKTSSEEMKTWLKTLKENSKKATEAAPVRASIMVPTTAKFDMSESLEPFNLDLYAPSPIPKPDGAPADKSIPEWRKKGKVEISLSETPGGREIRAVVYDSLEAPHEAALVALAAEPEWRKALVALEKKSHDARVSGIWLFLSYLLATLGELCLSPVGLSMVTKLAPARFASLFMGVWLLSSSVAQYVGGSIGESWGEIPPGSYFWIFVGTSIFGMALVAVLATHIKKLMHNVT
jgi:proton-dependent oligopeptide transporter, POT family